MFLEHFLHFCSKSVPKRWKFIGFLNAILKNEKVAKSLEIHMVFDIGNFVAKTIIIPYVSGYFFGLLLKKCSKNVGNSCVFDKEKLIAKT